MFTHVIPLIIRAICLADALDERWLSLPILFAWCPYVEGPRVGDAHVHRPRVSMLGMTGRVSSRVFERGRDMQACVW